MNKRLALRATRKLAGAVIAAIGCIGVVTAEADAGLTVDLRAVTLNNQPLPAGSTEKSVEVAAGDEVGINVFTVVSGTNALNDEAFSDMHGVFRSTTGGLLGDLGNSATVAPHSDAGSQNGSSIDIDSDGDMDIGASPNGGQSNMFFIARCAFMVYDGAPIPGANPAAEEFLIGTMTFTAKDSVTAGQETLLTFIRRANPNGTDNLAYASWQEDAAVRNGLSPYGVSGLAIVGVPEPGSVAALAGLAGLGLLARRRRANPVDFGDHRGLDCRGRANRTVPVSLNGRAAEL